MPTEQGIVSAASCMVPGLARCVAPRRYHRWCDLRGAGHGESAGHLAIRDLYREPDRSGQRRPVLPTAPASWASAV
jgi:hypothetical protein